MCENEKPVEDAPTEEAEDQATTESGNNQGDPPVGEK